MKTEVSTAANFVARLLRGTGLLSEEQLQQFRFSLEEALGGKKRPGLGFPLFKSKFSHIMVFEPVNIVLNKADETCFIAAPKFTETKHQKL